MCARGLVRRIYVLQEPGFFSFRFVYGGAGSEEFCTRREKESDQVGVTEATEAPASRVLVVPSLAGAACHCSRIQAMDALRPRGDVPSALSR